MEWLTLKNAIGNAADRGYASASPDGAVNIEKRHRERRSRGYASASPDGADGPCVKAEVISVRVSENSPPANMWDLCFGMYRFPSMRLYSS